MASETPLIHLASASPRRRELLSALRIPFTWSGVALDETRQDGEPAAALALRLARAKGLAAVADLPVLSADTIVVLGGRIFGKPRSRAHALDMLAALSGRTHRVLTAVALLAGGRQSDVVVETAVQFRDVDPDEALAYWHSGEPADKAGAYAIQGLGGMFVVSVRGSYSAVVGLPVYETVELLRDAGIDVLRQAGAKDPENR